MEIFGDWSHHGGRAARVKCMALRPLLGLVQAWLCAPGPRADPPQWSPDGAWLYSLSASAVTDLLKATPEEEILRRDIYERAPMFKWADGEFAGSSGLVRRHRVCAGLAASALARLSECVRQSCRAAWGALLTNACATVPAAASLPPSISSLLRSPRPHGAAGRLCCWYC